MSVNQDFRWKSLIPTHQNPALRMQKRWFHGPMKRNPSQFDMGPGRGMSRVMKQSGMVTTNHGCDLTDGTQMGASHENHLASMPIPVALSDNQHNVLFKEDDQ